MSFAVNTIVAKAQDAFRDMTTTKAVSYLNDIRPNLLSRLQQRRTSQDITLTAGTQQYVTSSSVRIDEVRYQKSATASDYDVVHPISKDELVREELDWGKKGQGKVRRYWLETGTAGAKIGFLNIPETTTSGGYPKVVIYGTETNTLSSGDTIYDDLPNSNIYVSGICLEYARARVEDQIPKWMKLHELDMIEAEAYLSRKQARNEGGRIVPAYRRRSGTT